MPRNSSKAMHRRAKANERFRLRKPKLKIYISNLSIVSSLRTALVQIPCIERNPFAALRALDANLYSMMSDGKHIISFDKVVDTMKLTGKDIPSLYKETAMGGLSLLENDLKSR